jgi:hypothetical protein
VASPASVDSDTKAFIAASREAAQSRSSFTPASLDLVKQRRRRGRDTRCPYKQPRAIRPVDLAIESEQPAIECVKLVSVCDARGREVNCIGWFQTGMPREHQPPCKICNLLIEVDDQDVVVVEEISNLPIVYSAGSISRQDLNQTECRDSDLDDAALRGFEDLATHCHAILDHRLSVGITNPFLLDVGDPGAGVPSNAARRGRHCVASPNILQISRRL